MKNGVSNGTKVQMDFGMEILKETIRIRAVPWMDANCAGILSQDGNLLCGETILLSGKNPFGTKRQSTDPDAI